MYCKFCGAMLDPNSVQCPSCNADIDLTDGGQSFFEDDELEMWRIAGAPLPNTSILEQTAPIPPLFMSGRASGAEQVLNKEIVTDAPEYDEETDADRYPSAFAPESPRHLAARSRKGDRNTRIIIGCIAGCMLLVVIVVAVIANILNRDKDNDKTDMPARTEEQQQQQEGSTLQPVQEEEQQQQQGGETPSQSATSKVITNSVRFIDDLPQDMYSVVEDVHIYDENQKLLEDYQVYLIQNVPYLSADHLMEHFGYVYREDLCEDPEVEAVYQGSDNQRITLKKGTSTIIIGETTRQLDGLCLNSGSESDPGSITYVPVISFLNYLGFTNAYVDEAVENIYFVRPGGN